MSKGTTIVLVVGIGLVAILVISMASQPKVTTYAPGMGTQSSFWGGLFGLAGTGLTLFSNKPEAPSSSPSYNMQSEIASGQAAGAAAASAGRRTV